MSRQNFRGLLIVLAAMFFAPIGSGAQQARMDSIESSLDARDDKGRYEGFLELGRYYLPTNINKSFEYVSFANRVAYKLADSAKIVQSGYALGFILRRQNRLNEAIRILSDVLIIAKRNGFSDDYVKSANLLALSYTFLTDYDKALELHFSCLGENEKIGREQFLSITYNNIGLVYFKLLEFDEALKYYRQSLAIKNQYGIDFDLDRLYVNMALCLNQLKQFDEAEEVIRLAFKTCENQCSNDLITEAKFALATSQFERGKYEEAEKNFLASIEFARKTDNLSFEADAFYMLGLIFGKYDVNKSLQALMQAEAINLQTDNIEQRIKVAKALGDIYERKNDLTNSLRYKNRYINLADSASGAEMRRNLVKIQTKYFERENLRTIEEKNQILLLREEALARQRMLIFAISTAVALSFILIYFVLRSARQQSIAKRKLAEAMVVIEGHNRNLTTTVKEKTNDLRLSNMELRKSYGEYDHLIYRASHDIRGPLTTLLGLTNLAKQEQDDPAKVKDYLAKIESTTEGLSAMLSQLTDINRIRNQPVCIEPVDVGALAEEVFRSFSYMDHFPLISLRLHTGEWKEGLRTDKALLRMILSHLIHNSFKYFSPHRQEKYIKVSWKQKEGRTFISVEDNGQGIDEKAGVKVFQLFYVASDSHGMGLGLFMAQLAARRLGGRIKLRRSKEPTTFQLILPNRPKEIEFALLDEDERIALMIRGQNALAALSSE